MNKGLMMKKTMLASLIGMATLCSGHVLAQVPASAPVTEQKTVVSPASATAATPVTSATPATPAATAAPEAPAVSAPAERPTVTSNLSTEQRKMLMDYVQNNEELNDLAHKERVLDYEAKLSKLELEKLKAERERDKLLGKDVPAISATEETQKAPSLQQIPSPDQDEEKEVVNPLDHIFITKVYGLDNNLRVTVYYKGTILQLRAGDEVADGIRMVRVFDNAAIFAKGKETRRVSMTTGKNAISKAFEEERDDEDMEMQIPSMATPMGFVPPPMQ